MRWQTRSFVKTFLNQKKTSFSKVLDVGSRSVDAQPTIRDLFKDVEYIGLDAIRGINVDIVLNAHDIKTKFSENTFDLVMCFDTLEHDDKFWITVENMKWVLKKGGWLLLGVPGRNMGEHDYPSDYWRFMPAGVRKLMKGLENCYEEIQTDDDNHNWEDEIYAWGQKL